MAIQVGSRARNYSSGIQIRSGTAALYNKSKAAGIGVDSADGFKLKFNQNGTIRTVGSVDSTDTLTNKTINLTSNTLVATSAQLATALTDETGTGALVFANTPTLVTPVIGAATGTSLLASSFIKSSSPAATGGVGYATGAGGVVTQITSRATGVTMVPNPCLSGTITTVNSSLAAEASADFVVTDSAVAIGDTVVVSIQSGSNSGNTTVTVATVTAGTFTIRVTNNNAAAGTAETGVILINFAIIKAVSA